jgi:AraC-like DNA-binding protein
MREMRVAFTRHAVEYFHLPGREGVELIVWHDLAQSLPLQFHDWIELRLVLGGSANISVGRSRSAVSTDSMLVIRPNALSGIQVGRGEPVSLLCLGMDPDLFRRPLNDSRCGSVPVGNSRAVFVDPDVRALVLALQRAMTEGASSSEGDTLLHQLVAAMSGRDWLDSPPMPRADDAPPLSIQRAMVFLTQRCAQEISLSELAAVAGLSKFHFLRLFSAHVGVTPHRYHLLLRVACARAMLRRGVEIADAALATGFCNQSHLTRCFHSVIGVSPRRYQGCGSVRSRAGQRNFIQDADSLSTKNVRLGLRSEYPTSA